jgi:hypothetical protein
MTQYYAQIEALESLLMANFLFVDKARKSFKSGHRNVKYAKVAFPFIFSFLQNLHFTKKNISSKTMSKI